MDITKNNFYLLNASLNDDKNVLAEKASEMEFELGEDVAQKCFTDLINPKRRLYSEIRWFLDEDDEELEEILQDIRNNRKIEATLFPLSFINTIEYQSKFPKETSVMNFVLNYYKSINSLSDRDITRAINKHRNYAGFPEANITDVSQEFGAYLTEVENKVLDLVFGLSPNIQSHLLFSFAQKISAKNNPYPSWGFPKALRERYELIYADAIKEKEEGISKYVKSLTNNYSPDSLSSCFKEIDKKLYDWEYVTRPINYINFTNDSHSIRSMSMLCSVRDFTLFLNNTEKNYKAAADLTRTLIKHCDYFPVLEEDLRKGLLTIENNKEVETKNKEIVKEHERSQLLKNVVGLLICVGFYLLIYACSR